MIQQQEVSGEQLIPTRDGGALVASASAPGGWHVVQFGQCDCKGFQYRSTCRHVKAVASYNGLDREQALADELADYGEYMSFAEFQERRASGRE